MKIIKKGIATILTLIIVISFGNNEYILADNYGYIDEEFTNLIYEYYKDINDRNYMDILQIYSTSLQYDVYDFFVNERNRVNHEGIYNVVDVEVDMIEKISSSESVLYNSIYYSKIDKYFVSCYMNVYETDKYYMQGDNYFEFTIGKDENGDVEIVDIEIASYNNIKKYVKTSFEQYISVRNYLIYGEESDSASCYAVRPGGYDAPVYVDYVDNPANIRILYNGTVQTIDFKTYLERTVAVECNSGLDGIETYKACAMAVKMYAIHKVLKRAVGYNYDIKVPDDQDYDPNKPLSENAKAAVNYIYDYFLLDYYGAVFMTPYRTKVSDSSYCVNHGGIMPQINSETAGMSWKDKLYYYYTRIENTSYYNNDMNYGSLIITYKHTHDWSSGENCGVCGARAVNY